MRVLIVCSYREYIKSGVAPFIEEQVNAIKMLGVDFDYFQVKGKGILGYLKNRKALIKKIKEFKPDLVHAHYGLCGLLANLQRSVPVITTYHGSDINDDKSFKFSKFSLVLSKWNIFVAPQLAEKANLKKKYSIIPCGINVDNFIIKDKNEARASLNLDPNKKYVLFSKMFDIAVKNYPLAKEAMDKMKEEATLLEFKGYTREQAVLLMNAVDCAIMTSKTEGSPQFIKEAMACCCPIVSVDVGDVKNIVGETEGCFITSREPMDIANKLDIAVNYGKTSGRNRMLQNYDNNVIAKNIYDIYVKCMK